ncbi:hypothetical protein MMC27_004601 [Xylographa pallens]|nr:hypothetical protein [Xylographa pallens]
MSEGLEKAGGEPADEASDNEISYSVFSIRQKRCIVSLVAFAGWFSTLSSFIYFPAIPPLATSLHVSIEDINLTVTSYLVVSGLAPSIIGDCADDLGRRPVIMVALLIYVATNVGLAVQKSYAALFALRMLQSAGISGTFSIAYGVVADVTSPAERGSFVGIVSLGTNTAPSLGPLLGGLLAGRFGWRAIFWFLSMASAACLLAIIFALPETLRKLVGNGSIRAVGVNRLPFTKVELQAGLIYLPFGLGCAIAAYLTGRLLDRDYRRTADLHNFPICRATGDDLAKFPIELARLRSVFYPLSIAIAAIVGYGWAVQAKIVGLMHPPTALNAEFMSTLPSL